jgi:hypothetical protein
LPAVQNGWTFAAFLILLAVWLALGPPLTRVGFYSAALTVGPVTLPRYIPWKPIHASFPHDGFRAFHWVIALFEKSTNSVSPPIPPPTSDNRRINRPTFYSVSCWHAGCRSHTHPRHPFDKQACTQRLRSSGAYARARAAFKTARFRAAQELAEYAFPNFVTHRTSL